MNKVIGEILRYCRSLHPDGTEVQRTNLEKCLNSKEFYELMQAYRHVHINNQDGAVQAFDKVKEFILSSLEPC